MPASNFLGLGTPKLAFVSNRISNVAGFVNRFLLSIFPMFWVGGLVWLGLTWSRLGPGLAWLGMAGAGLAWLGPGLALAWPWLGPG